MSSFNFIGQKNDLLEKRFVMIKPYITFNIWYALNDAEIS